MTAACSVSAAAAVALLTAGAGSALAQDTLAQDTLAADTLPADTTPILPRLQYPEEWVVARWDRAELWLSTALTLGELLESVPWLRAVRFGFLEGPAALTAFGAGAVAVEYTIDGYRIVPQGSAVEPIAIPLTDIDLVEVRRVAGGYRVDVTTRRLEGAAPYSAVEGGTGDYDVTLLRGLFLSRFFGGEVGFGLDRVETRGFSALGRAERIATTLSYARRLPWGWGAQVRWRNSSVNRTDLEAPDRSDLSAHLRRRFGVWTVDLTAGRTRTTIDSVAGDTLPTRDFEEMMYGVQITALGSRTAAAFRFDAYEGAGVPDFLASGALEVRPLPWLALGGDARTTVWDENYYEGAGRIRLTPHDAVALGFDFEMGSRRVGGLDPVIEVEHERLTWVGSLDLFGFDLAAGAGRWRTTPSAPLGFFYDRAAAPDPGGSVWVWRVGGSAPTPIRNLRLTGGYEDRGAGDFLYWPRYRADAGAKLRGLYVGGQLEVNASFRLVVRGPMRSFDTESMPTSRVTLDRRIGSAGDLVVRIKDVRVFLSFEGFSDPEESEDVGGAQFPQTRTVFGLKWEFWN